MEISTENLCPDCRQAEGEWGWEVRKGVFIYLCDACIRLRQDKEEAEMAEGPDEEEESD